MAVPSADSPDTSDENVESSGARCRSASVNVDLTDIREMAHELRDTVRAMSINRTVVDEGDEERGRPSNEYVLNVAFVSFMLFVMLQTIFALIARSQAMLADSEAMAVDALTYLFNLVAERLKHRPLSKAERALPEVERIHHRRRMCLLLEIIPPLISVTTLVVLTMFVLKEAMETLAAGADEDNGEKEPNVGLMFFFSGLNLALDVLNVTCFARANILSLEVRPPSSARMGEMDSVQTSLMGSERAHALYGSSGVEMERIPANNAVTTNNTGEDYAEESEAIRDIDEDDANNLNMCSAFTHVCADTMRSIAVLVAAGIAGMFDSIDPEAADAVAAVVVSIIIILSLIPLFQGLFRTWADLIDLERQYSEKNSAAPIADDRECCHDEAFD